MHISWLGISGFKIEFKTATTEGTMLIDPYNNEAEAMPRSLGAELVLATHGEKELITLTKEPFVISEAGEYEYKEVLVYGFQTTLRTDAPLVFRLEVEHMTIAHLGMLPAAPDEKLLNELNGVDILMVPVGGGGSLTAERAAELVTKIEPRIVIPYAFKAKGTGADFAEVTAFLKAVGSQPEMQQKLKITKKDLPSDQLVVALLEKQ